MIWPHLKDLWLRKDDSTGHSERIKKGRDGKTVLKSGQGWTLLASSHSSTRAAVD